MSNMQGQYEVGCMFMAFFFGLPMAIILPPIVVEELLRMRRERKAKNAIEPTSGKEA